MTLASLTALVFILLISSVLATGMSLPVLYKLGGQLWRRPTSDENSLEPVAELPPGWEERLEPWVSELLALGFQWVGNFRASHAGQTAWTRVFLSADERTFATVSDRGAAPYVFGSLFEDGRYLESSITADATLPGDNFLQRNTLPNATAATLWHSHVEAICERRILSGSDVLCWAPEQYREVATYVQQLSRWRQGLGPQPAMPAGRELTGVA